MAGMVKLKWLKSGGVGRSPSSSTISTKPLAKFGGLIAIAPAAYTDFSPFHSTPWWPPQRAPEAGGPAAGASARADTEQEGKPELPPRVGAEICSPKQQGPQLKAPPPRSSGLPQDETVGHRQLGVGAAQGQLSCPSESVRP